MGNIANGELNTFVDGQIVSANDATYGLNPKMEVIRAAVNDNDSRIAVLEGQIGSLGLLFYNVKASPYNAVGDGIADDTVAIQAAITAASAVNGTVVIPYGTYKITDSLTILGGCCIQSEGSRSGVVVKQTVTNKTIFTVSSSNVRINSLTLDMAATTTESHVQSTSATGTSPYTEFSLDNCRLISSTSSYCTSAINLSNVNSSRILNCNIGSFGTYLQAIWLRSCINFTIFNNRIRNSAANGLVVSRSSGSTTTYPQSQNITISNNLFADCAYDSIVLYSVSNCLINSNRFTRYFNGVVNFSYIKTDQVDSLDNSYVTVSNNDFNGIILGSGNSTIGLNLSYISSLIVDSNQFYECGTSLGCIYVKDRTAYGLQVSSNNFLQCSTYIVNFDSDTTTVTTRSVISNNQVTDVYSSSLTTAVVHHLSKTFLTVVGNSLVRGTKSATNVNSYGIFTSYNVNDARILSSGNNFSAALTAPYYFATANTVCIFNDDITGDRIFYGFALTAPASGTFRQGDKLMLLSPTAGGYIGYVCTTAGTPGTWKGFGAIQV